MTKTTSLHPRMEIVRAPGNPGQLSAWRKLWTILLQDDVGESETPTVGKTAGAHETAGSDQQKTADAPTVSGRASHA